MQTPSTLEPRHGWLRRIDDVVYDFERLVVASFLMAITAMIFLDVVNRRLITEDTKLGGWLARILGVHDAATLKLLHEQAAPLGYALLGFALLWFCTVSAQRELGRPLLGLGKHAALAVAIALFAGISGVLWLMLHTSSRTVYLLLYGAFLLGYGATQLASREHGYVRHLLVLVLASVPVIAFIVRYVPEGYAWSQKMSLMLLMWVGFFGASICVHDGKHLFVEAIVAKLPPKLQRIAIGIGFLVAACFTALMTVLGYQYTFHPETGALHMGGIIDLTEVPDWVMAVPLPVAFAIATLRFVAAAIAQLTGGDYGSLAKAEGMAEAEQLATEQEAA